MKDSILSLLLLISLSVTAQNIPVFKAGAFKKGTLIKTTTGSLWVAAKDIAHTSTIPQENIYWDEVVFNSGRDLPLFEGIDNAPILKAAIDAIPKGGRGYINLPMGDFFTSKMIVWHHKTISLIGKGVGITILKFTNTGGIKVTRESSIARSKISSLSIISQGSKNSNANGIEALAITDLSDIYIKGFGGHGIKYYGSLGFMVSDVSGSVVTNVEAAECGGDGFRIEGGDANAITFTGCNFRDNAGVGWKDLSFLGSTALGCMGHNNKGGDFYVGTANGLSNNNSRTVLTGSYSEGGSPPSQLSVYTTVIGGTWGSGFIILGNNGGEKHGTYLPLEGDQYYNDANSFYSEMKLTPKQPKRK